MPRHTEIGQRALTLTTAIKSFASAIGHKTVNTVDFIKLGYNESKAKVVELIDSFKQMNLSANLSYLREQILASIGGHGVFSERLLPYFEGRPIPYRDYANEPEQVSQLKKILNALYYAEQAVLRMERLQIHRDEIREGEELGRIEHFSHLFGEFRDILAETIPQVQHAILLSSQGDLHLTQVFGSEWQALSQYITLAQGFFRINQVSMDVIDTDIAREANAYSLGRGAGILIDQMQPHAGGADFGFIAQFTQVLPAKLADFTEKMRDLSPTLADDLMQLHGSVRADLIKTIDAKKLAELQDYGQQMLVNLETVFGGGLGRASVFELVTNPFKVLSMLRLIRPIYELSNAILAEVKNSNSSIQNTIKARLAQLKYETILPLFAHIDKIEEYSFLKPGTLSRPLMAFFVQHYTTLVQFSSIVAEFKPEEEILLHIEDILFVEKRAQVILERRALQSYNAEALSYVDEAVTRFFQLLNREEYRGQYVLDLPNDIKQQLIRDYKIIQRCVRDVDVQFDYNLTEALNFSSAFTDGILRWLPGIIPTTVLDASYVKLTVEDVVSHVGEIENMMAKAHASHDFILLASQDLVLDVYARTHHVITPYDLLRSNPFVIDEAKVLNLELDDFHLYGFKHQAEHFMMTHLQAMDEVQISQLSQFYTVYDARLVQLRRACQEISHILDMDDYALHKVKLCQLYLQIQPYLYHSIQPEAIREISDRGMVIALKETSPIAQLILRRDEFRNLTNALNQALAPYQAVISQRQIQMSNRAIQAGLNELRRNPLTTDEALLERADYVINHTAFSQVSGQLADALKGMTQYLGQAPQAYLLKEADVNSWTIFKSFIDKHITSLGQYIPEGVPYPELEDKLKALAEPHQVKWMKRLINFSYHLNQFSLKIERLKKRPEDLPDNEALQRAFRASQEAMGLDEAGWLETFDACLRGLPRWEMTYAYQVANAYRHVKLAYDAIEGVYHDPFANQLCRAILKDLDDGQLFWNTIKPIYAQKSELIQRPAGKVEWGGLWYPMLNFMLIPSQLEEMMRFGRDLPAHRILAIQQHAKTVALEIQYIINEHDSRLRHIIGIPQYLGLYSELHQRVLAFAGMTHQAVIENLQEIRATQFTQLIAIADDHEARYGLMPGLISGPINMMLERFYQGFLEPLGLSSEEHIRLASLSISTEKRREMIELQRRALIIEKADFSALSTKLLQFQMDIKAYQSAPYDAQVIVNLKTNFNELLPRFRDELHAIELPRKTNAFEVQLDHLLQGDNVPLVFENIRYLTDYLRAKYQGQLDTLVFKEKYLDEKIAYLDRELGRHVSQRHDFIHDFVLKKFDKRVNQLLDAENLFEHVKDEFKAAFKVVLEENKQEIINEVCRVHCAAQPVEREVEKRIRKQLSRFVSNQCADFFKLNSLVKVINEIDAYCQKTLDNVDVNFYESIDTLARKTLRVNQLKALAANTELSVSARLEQMRAIVAEPTFSRDLLSHKQYDAGTYKWFKNLVCRLLSLLGLYTIQHEVHEKQLRETVGARAPRPAELASRMGIFKRVGQDRGYDAPQLEPQIAPEVP